MLIDANGNPGEAQRLQGRMLLHFLRAFLIGQHPDIHPALLCGNQRFHRSWIREPIDRDIDIALRLMIERQEAVEGSVVRGIQYLDVGAEQRLRL